MVVKCEDFRAFVSKALRGFATIHILDLGIVIADCQVFEKDGRRWVELPKKEYNSPRNGRVWRDVVRFKDPKVLQEFQVAATAAVESYSSMAQDRSLRSCSSVFA